MSNVASAHERMILPPLLTLFCKTSSAYASHDCYLSDATLAHLIGRCRGVQSVYCEKIVQRIESESTSVCLSAPNNSSTTELKAHITSQLVPHKSGRLSNDPSILFLSLFYPWHRISRQLATVSVGPVRYFRTQRPNRCLHFDHHCTYFNASHSHNILCIVSSWTVSEDQESLF